MNLVVAVPHFAAPASEGDSGGEPERGESRIKGRILESAIHLFGKFSFEGVTTRGIAKQANCMEGGIYRLYRDKRRLYEQAIAAVVEAALSNMAKLALDLYAESSGSSDLVEIVQSTVHCWYSSMSLDSARLLQQVRLNDAQHKQLAERPFEHVLAILQKTLRSRLEDGNIKLDLTTRTECLIWALFQLKLAYTGPADEEHRELDRFVQDWLQTIPVTEEAQGGTAAKTDASSHRSVRW